MKTLTAAITLLIFSFLSSPAFASLLELRVGYEMQSIKSIENQDANLPSHTGINGLTADFLFIPTDLVLGVRYENLSAKKTGSNDYYTEAKLTRTSAIIGYRMFNTGIYFGPLLTVGIVSDLKYKIQSAAASELKASKTTVGLGFEAGVHLLGLLVGAEVGYLSANMGKLQDDAGDARGANGSNMNADLSGTYARALIGLAF